MRLRTRRLLLRPLSETDTDALHELWTDAGVRRYLWDDEIISIAQTRATIATSTRLFDAFGVGLWGAWSLTDDTLLGFAGYYQFRDPPEIELLFGVASGHWGQGLATEAARAVLQYGFDNAGFDRIHATADAPNADSLRVLEKLGMQLQRRTLVDDLDTCFFSIDRSHWPPADG